MTTETQTTQSTSNKPTHVARKRIGQGRKAEFETIGVAWVRDNGSLYLKLTGTQVIDSGFYLFPNAAETDANPA